MNLQVTQNGTTVWDEHGKPHFFPTDTEAIEWIEEEENEKPG